MTQSGGTATDDDPRARWTPSPRSWGSRSPPAARTAARTARRRGRAGPTWRSPARAPRSRTRSTRSGSASSRGRAPGLSINYQSIGSGGGIRQITERTVDFGATDAPHERRAARGAAPRGRPHPDLPRGGGVTYNLDGVPSGLHLTPEAVAGIFLGTVTRVGRPALQQARTRGRRCPAAHHRRPPLRRQRHDAHLHRLARRGEPRLEGKGPARG